MDKTYRNDWTLKIDDVVLIVYDFDGVMTDNRVIISEDGKESVSVNRADGLAVAILKDKGVKQIILSKEKNSVVATRARKLGIPVLQGVDNKDSVLKQYCRDNDVPLTKVVFIGNDVNDIDVMKIVGCPLCPEDAFPEVKAEAKYIIPTKGGHGVIRELLCHLISEMGDTTNESHT